MPEQLESKEVRRSLAAGVPSEDMAERILNSTTFYGAVGKAAQHGGRIFTPAHAGYFRKKLKNNLVRYLERKRHDPNISLQTIYCVLTTQAAKHTASLPQTENKEAATKRIPGKEQKKWFKRIREGSNEALSEAAEYYLDDIRNASKMIAGKTGADEEELFAEGSELLVKAIRDHASEKKEWSFATRLEHVKHQLEQHAKKGRRLARSDFVQGPPSDESGGLEQVINRITAGQELARIKPGVKLTDSEKHILKEHYGRGATLAEIAEKLNKSQEYIYREHERALNRFRIHLGMPLTYQEGSEKAVFEDIFNRIRSAKPEEKNRIIGEVFESGTFNKQKHTALAEQKTSLTEEELAKVKEALVKPLRTLLYYQSATPFQFRARSFFKRNLPVIIRKVISEREKK